MNTRAPLLALALALALSAACTDPSQAPAEAALRSAEVAITSLGELGARYAPEQTQDLQKVLANAKALEARKDYKGALAASSDVPAKASQILTAATARRDEVVKGWNEVSAAVPQSLAAVKGRLDALAQSKKLPAGLVTATVEQAKVAAADIEAAFAAVLGQAKAGDLAGATVKATELNSRCAEILKTLGT